MLWLAHIAISPPIVTGTVISVSRDDRDIADEIEVRETVTVMMVGRDFSARTRMIRSTVSCAYVVQVRQDQQVGPHDLFEGDGVPGLRVGLCAGSRASRDAGRPTTLHAAERCSGQR